MRGAGGTGGTCPARARCTSRGYGGNPGSVRRPMTSRLTHYCVAVAGNVTPLGKKVSGTDESAGQRCDRRSGPAATEAQSSLGRSALYEGLGEGAGVSGRRPGVTGAKAEGAGETTPPR